MRKYRSYHDLILNSAAEGIIGLDIYGRHTFCNKAVETILGYTAEDLIGQKSHDTWHSKKVDGSDFPDLECPIYKAVSNKDIVRMDEDVFWKKDKTKLFVQYVASPLSSENNVIGTVVIFTDITRQKAAEEELRIKSHVIEQSPLSIIITDPTARIEYVNPAFINNTGYTYDEIIGKNPRYFSSGEKGITDYETMWKKLSMGETWKGEFLNKNKNGELIWEDVTISPIKKENGKITHFAEIKNNITEQKKLLQELIKHQQNLEKAQQLAHLTYWEWNLEKGYFRLSRSVDKNDPFKQQYSVKSIRRLLKKITNPGDYPAAK